MKCNSVILCVNVESLTKMREEGMFMVFVDLESDGEKSNYQ